MSVATPNVRPARLGGTLAVALALVAVGTLAPSAVRPALAVEAAALAGLAGGLGLLRRGWRLLGGLVAVLALGGVGVGMALVWVRTGDYLAVAQFVPGMIGAFVLALGVLPARGNGSRRLVKLGTAVVFLSVFAAGIVQRPTLTTLLAGGVATVLAWDAGENAIGVGTQLGRRASTHRIELVHVGASALVGLVAIAATRAVVGVGIVGLPLAAFGLLVVALVLLAAAIHD